MRRQELIFLSQLFVLVLFLGGYALLSLSSPLPDDILPRAKQVAQVDPFQQEGFTVEESQRQPASIGGSVTGSLPSLTKSYVSSLNWGCEEPSIPQLQTENFQIRLNGKCKLSNLLSITNKSNGYTASIFSNTKSQYTTDFIQLSEGENIIEILQKQKDGTPISKTIRVLMSRNQD